MFPLQCPVGKETKKRNKLKLSDDYRIRLSGILAIAALRLGLMVVSIYNREVGLWETLENTLLVGLLIWETSRAVVLYFHRRYPLHQFKGRLFALESWCCLLLCLSCIRCGRSST